MVADMTLENLVQKLVVTIEEGEITISFPQVDSLAAQVLDEERTRLFRGSDEENWERGEDVRHK